MKAWFTWSPKKYHRAGTPVGCFESLQNWWWLRKFFGFSRAFICFDGLLIYSPLVSSPARFCFFFTAENLEKLQFCQRVLRWSTGIVDDTSCYKEMIGSLRGIFYSKTWSTWTFTDELFVFNVNVVPFWSKKVMVLWIHNRGRHLQLVLVTMMRNLLRFGEFHSSEEITPRMEKRPKPY